MLGVSGNLNVGTRCDLDQRAYQVFPVAGTITPSAHARHDRQLPQTALVHGTEGRMASLTPNAMPHKARLQRSHREYPLVPSITACDITTDQPRGSPSR